MATSTPSARSDAPQPRRNLAELRVEPEGVQAVGSTSAGWQLWLALVVAAAIVIPRSVMIARAHSDSYDDDYHLTRGLAFLTRSFGTVDLRMNDPPLAEGLIAVPMLVTNAMEGRSATDDRLFDRPGRAETLALRMAVWNSILFLPLVGVVFHWTRKTYGTRSAWLAVGMLLLEPTFAALIPIPTPDIAGVSGIAVGCFLAWRYFERPATGRLIAAGVGTAAALLLKHTAAILPVVILAMAGLQWVVKPWLDRQDWSAWWSAVPRRIGALTSMGLVGVISLWALTLFDISPPVSPTTSDHALSADQQSATGSVHSTRMRLEKALRLTEPWPAGIYLRAFRTGLAHGMKGHEAYLFGERRLLGWWYYYPAVAAYKVPIGISLVFLLALLSLRHSPPRWAEWGLLMPLAAWTLFLMKSKVNIGFRHFLPAYLFFLVMASRCLAAWSWRWSLAAWSAVAVAGLHVATFTPDYLAYINYPRHKPHLAISDSNIDWGQSLKQVREWVDSRPPDGRPISLVRFGKDQGGIRYYLGDRVRAIPDGADPPTRGVLIISGVLEASPYDPREVYRTLWPHKPEAQIGHCMMVYDLDRLGAGSPFRWTYRNAPHAGEATEMLARRASGARTEAAAHPAPAVGVKIVPAAKRAISALVPPSTPGARKMVPLAIPGLRTSTSLTRPGVGVPVPAAVPGVKSPTSANVPGVNSRPSAGATEQGR